MKLRTQFVLTFLLLAVLPLGAIVLYSYHSSRGAFSRAVQADALALAEDLRERIDSERLSLASRFRALEELPTGEGLADEKETFYARVVEGLGESAPLLSSLEFVPIAPAPPGGPELSDEPLSPDLPVLAPPAPLEPGEVVQVDLATEVPLEVVIPDEAMAAIEGSIEIGFNVAESFVAYFGDEEDLEELRQAREETSQEVLSQVIGQALEAQETALDHQMELLDERLERATAELEELDRAGPEPARVPSREEHGELEQDQAKVLRIVEQEAEAGSVSEEEREERGERISRYYARRNALTAEQEEMLTAERRRMELLLGSDLVVPVRRGGRLVGEIKPQIRAEELLSAVLEETRREQGEIPFAVDADGGLYTAGEPTPALEGDLRATAKSLEEGSTEPGIRLDADWMIVAQREPDTGLMIGIARPVRESLAAMRLNSVRNFLIGLGLMGLALFGVLPLSNRLTRDLEALNDGARSLADGDLDARVEVRSRSEVGELAGTFNRMASELDSNQKRLVRQEVEQQVLAAEHERKSHELDEARRFQLSLLPKTLPVHPRLEVAVLTHTAAEVGGDYYDFRSTDTHLTVAIGDATGHGAKAGTMVAVIKSLLTAQSDVEDLPAFLADASSTISRMELGRMAMALTLVRTDGQRLTVAAAGMPPLLLHRPAGDGVREVTLEGPPLGSMSRPSYQEATIEVVAGDTLLLMTDGFPELLDGEGEPFGYDGVHEAFATAAALPPDQVCEALLESAHEWAGDEPPGDDMTFVVLRVR